MARRSFSFLIKSIVVILIILSYISEISSLYEDQAGKFDWKKSYIGKVKFADFKGVDRVIVATEENVLACLNIKNGEILWRQEMENSGGQQTELFYVNKEITTVSDGENTWYVRGWEINTGILLWEWTVNSEPESLKIYWSIYNRELISVNIFDSFSVQVNVYSLESGDIQKRKTIEVPGLWMKGNIRCITIKNFLACLKKNGGLEAITYINLFSDLNDISTIPIEFPGAEEADIMSFDNENLSILFIKNSMAKIINLKSEDIIPGSFLSNVINVKNEEHNQLYQLEINANNPNKLLRIKVHDENGKPQQSVDVEYPKGIGAPYILAGHCTTRDCNLLLSSIDHALILVRVSDGKVIWIREEALSDIVAVEFFELPVSELDASIENEFKTSTHDIFSMFIHRITTQTIQLSNLIFGSQLTMNNMLVRDDFGLHKIIVVVTRVGKLFALDTLSGHIVWSYRLPHIIPFDKGNEGNILLFVQRTARYSPLPAQCSLLASDDISGLTVLFQFDPITGYSKDGITMLNKKILQAMLLPYEDENHLKPIITVDKDGSVDVYPKQAESIVKKHLPSIYLYIVIDDVMNGYSLQMQSGKIKTSFNGISYLDPQSC
ncbi:hypothetical protein WA026_020140 [Henosepilachna vigintioctopunctata]|uniref:EMC1 first beta-propeller domain-containing protein n=1 Tax=Henosepilachna vigintioctopunctata TaxID=420089 RepID=A0AAW1U274_9CUCU